MLVVLSVWLLRHFHDSGRYDKRTAADWPRLLLNVAASGSVSLRIGVSLRVCLTGRLLLQVVVVDKVRLLLGVIVVAATSLIVTRSWSVSVSVACVCYRE